MKRRHLLGVTLALPLGGARAGRQREEDLSDAVRSALSAAVAADAPPHPEFPGTTQRMAYLRWLTAMSQRLQPRKTERRTRVEFLETLWYESRRAGLEPDLVLGVVQVESNFRKYAVSSAGARGFMQVMPFWTQVIGSPDHNLFHLRTGLRYGCTILRHYLDIERGDMYRALARYNGSLGKNSGYSEKVLGAWRRHWAIDGPAPRSPAHAGREPAPHGSATAPRSPARAATAAPPAARPHASAPMKYMGTP